jgi:hypothetical protein
MVLSTLLRQATSAGVLVNPAKLNRLLQAFVHNVRTDNVTLDDLLNIAESLGNLDPDRVTFYTLPTVPEGEGLAMTSAGPLIWNALVNDQPLPGEVTSKPTPPSTSSSTSTHTSKENSAHPSTSATPTPLTSVITRLITSTPHPKQTLTVSPGEVNLQVVNVAGRLGVATLGMNALNPLGFDIAEPDLLLIPGDVRPGITVQFSPGHRAEALTVAAAVPRSHLVRKKGLGDQIRLFLGSSFDGTVAPVSVGANVPARLSTTAPPVVSTSLSTTVTTPTPSGESAPTTSSTPPSTSTPTKTSSTLSTLSNVRSVNAANKACI